MDLFEIHNMRHPWNRADYPRPWLIVGFPPGRDVVGCFPIATECYDGNCFYLDEDHPDFPATGLAHSCNIHDKYVIEISGGNILNRRGELAGGLLSDFRKYSGL